MRAPALIRPSPFDRDFGPFATTEAVGGSRDVLVAIERFRPQPGGVAVQNPALRICRHLDAPLRFSRRLRGGRFAPEYIAPGQFFLFGAGSEALFAWATSFRTLSVTIAGDLLATLAPPGGSALPVEVCADDAVLERLTGLALLDAEQGFPRGPLFAEGVGLAMAAHLAHRRAGGVAARAETLGPAALRRLRETIEALLPGRIGLAELAAAAQIPPHRLGAAFRRATGRSLWDVVGERRVAQAEALLLTSSLTLGQVAARVGYSSQAHMTTAFRRHRGMTPTARRALRRS